MHPHTTVTATTRRWGGLGHHPWTALVQGAPAAAQTWSILSRGGVSREDLRMAFSPLDAKKPPQICVAYVFSKS